MTHEDPMRPENPQLRVEPNVVDQVFAPVPVGQDLEHEVDSPTLGFDDKAGPIMQRDVEDDHEVGREGRRAGVVDAQVRRHERPPGRPARSGP